MPSSRARSMIASESSSEVSGPKFIVPRHSRLTSSPVRPRWVYSTCKLQRCGVLPGSQHMLDTMFDTLSDRLQDTFARLRGHGRLSEAQVDAALREVRLALLEADVNFKVVKDFVARVRERALGTDLLNGVNPGQQIVKIVHDELVSVLGGERHRLSLDAKPSVLMLVGLQGSGKTTTAAKLAVRLRKDGKQPLLVAADVYRPAAVDQLVQLGDQVGV